MFLNQSKTFENIRQPTKTFENIRKPTKHSKTYENLRYLRIKTFENLHSGKRICVYGRCKTIEECTSSNQTQPRRWRPTYFMNLIITHEIVKLTRRQNLNVTGVSNHSSSLNILDTWTRVKVFNSQYSYSCQGCIWHIVWHDNAIYHDHHTILQILHDKPISVLLKSFKSASWY